MKTTYAICTGTGQTMFWTESGRWTLAPSQNIRLFTSQHSADQFIREHMARPMGDALRTMLARRSPMVLRYTA